MIGILAVVTQVGDDLADAQDRAEGLLDTLVDSLPRIGIALGTLLVSWVIARVVRSVLHKRWQRSRTRSFANVMSRVTGWLIIIAGAMFAVTIAFPSIDPVDVIAGLGLVSVAAGFAFQDVLSNLLSGFLLILRQPFVRGDQIEIDDISGTVEEISIRETVIITYDGRRVLIPNRDVYQNTIRIQTALPAVRTNIVVGCSYDDDLSDAAGVALGALRGCDGVLDDPEPEAYFIEFGESSIDLDLRWWSDPHQAEIRVVQHRVVIAVKAAFDDAGLDIPWPIRTLAPHETLSAVMESPTTDGDGSRGGTDPAQRGA